MITGSVKNGARSVLQICAYVVFFQVFSAFLPKDALLRGLIELTGGVLLLSGTHSMVVAAFLIGWGGISVAFQVFSALEGSTVSAARYLSTKLLHGGIMAVCVFLFRFGAFYPLLFGAVLFAVAFFVKTGGKKVFSKV